MAYTRLRLQIPPGPGCWVFWIVHVFCFCWMTPNEQPQQLLIDNLRIIVESLQQHFMVFLAVDHLVHIYSSVTDHASLSPFYQPYQTTTCAGELEPIHAINLSLQLLP